MSNSAYARAHRRETRRTYPLTPPGSPGLPTPARQQRKLFSHIILMCALLAPAVVLFLVTRQRINRLISEVYPSSLVDGESGGQAVVMETPDMAMEKAVLDMLWSGGKKNLGSIGYGVGGSSALVVAKHWLWLWSVEAMAQSRGGSGRYLALALALVVAALALYGYGGGSYGLWTGSSEWQNLAMVGTARDLLASGEGTGSGSGGSSSGSGGGSTGSGSGGSSSGSGSGGSGSGPGSSGGSSGSGDGRSASGTANSHVNVFDWSRTTKVKDDSMRRMAGKKAVVKGKSWKHVEASDLQSASKAEEAALEKVAALPRITPLDWSDTTMGSSQLLVDALRNASSIQILRLLLEPETATDSGRLTPSLLKSRGKKPPPKLLPLAAASAKHKELATLFPSPYASDASTSSGPDVTVGLTEGVASTVASGGSLWELRLPESLPLLSAAKSVWRQLAHGPSKPEGSAQVLEPCPLVPDFKMMSEAVAKLRSVACTRATRNLAAFRLLTLEPYPLVPDFKMMCE
eukprot:gene3857-13919_t